MNENPTDVVEEKKTSSNPSKKEKDEQAKNKRRRARERSQKELVKFSSILKYIFSFSLYMWLKNIYRLV